MLSTLKPFTPWKLNVAPGAQLLYLHHLVRLQLSEHADKDALFTCPSNNPSCLLSVYSVSQLEFKG